MLLEVRIAVVKSYMGGFWYVSNVLFLDLGVGYKHEFIFMKTP